HEDLASIQGGVAQENLFQVHVHTRIAVRGKLRGGAGNTCSTKVLNGLDETVLEQLEAAFDEDLLHEGVAHLNRGTLGWHAALEGLRSKNRGAADTVAARAGTEQH